MYATALPRMSGRLNSRLAFATQVIQRTAADVIAKWQLVGFAHGVMNTDNLNITGSTLDFGPYGFMNVRPNWINNHSDYQGRYTYQQQPSIGHWNLWMWLNNLIRLKKMLRKKNSLNRFSEVFATFRADLPLEHYTLGLCQKWACQASIKTVLIAAWHSCAFYKRSNGGLHPASTVYRISNMKLLRWSPRCRQFESFLA